MSHARSPYTIFREIAAFLSIAFLLFPGRMSAQEYRASKPPCDSVVVDDGQGHRSVTLIPQAVVPSKSESTSDNIVNRRQFTTIEEILKEQELQDRRMREGQRSVQTRDLSAYSTGSIPIEESISPSGGRIYSVPIPTASGWNLTPGISLVYNSQGGNNIAGYGWGLSGLPSITVRNSNLYYDGVVHNIDGDKVYGACQRTELTRYTAYIFRNACSSKQQLYFTLGHEYYHAYLWKIGIPSDSHHSIISDWQLRQAVEWNYNVMSQTRYYHSFHNDLHLGFDEYNYLKLNELIPIIKRWYIL